MLTTLLFPSCPDDCPCRFGDFNVFPIVFVAIGVLWLLGGLGYCNVVSTHRQYQQASKEATIVLAAFEVDAFEAEGGELCINSTASDSLSTVRTTSIPVIHNKKRWANV